MSERMARGVRLTAWAAIVLPACEAIARQLTRTRPVPGLPENAALLALWPLAGLLALFAVDRWTRSAPRARVASVLAGLFAIGLCFQLHLGARLQSDGFYYYAYLRSIAFDADVNFLNDYALLGQRDKPQLFEPTATGHAHSAWTIGPAIVWAPFFAVGHVAAVWLKSQGADVAVDGTSYPYRQAVCIAGLFYALLGAWLARGFARRAWGNADAGLAVALLVGGSFMLWYAVVEPTMTHAPSMAAVAGFAWLWCATRTDRRLAHWALLGALAGLATLIRWQNAIFAILPACDVLWALNDSRAGDRIALRRTIAGGAIFALAAAAACLPQMLAWKAIYGSYLAVSPLGPAIDPWRPHLADVLFSSRNGLLAMSPVLYVALLGTLVFAIRRPPIGLPVLAAFAAMTWFNASIYDWWGSDGYGGRRFDGIVPLLVPGMAIAIAGARTFVARRPHLVAGLGLAGLVVWNVTLMRAAGRGEMRLGEPIAFGVVGAAQVRDVHRWIGHPFEYPVNLWFAARNGLPPSSYDLLFAFRFLNDPARPYGQIDVGGGDEIYVDAGWHAPERDGDRSFRWAAREATLLVPLARAADLDVQVRLRAFSAPGAPPQRVTFVTGTAESAPVAVPADWETVAVALPRSVWRRGVTRLTLRFGWSARPSDVGLGGDTRELAAAIDHVRISLREAAR
ncbi:MAG TPA: hypothetical protein VFO19_04605 [Vicinamibacterales bacterium]|nr:hypothetical protein [Vicinamibacterales bacterium]